MAIEKAPISLETLAAIGRETIKVATSHIFPITWGRLNPSDPEVLHNATGFILDCGEGPFAVTAAHVVRSALADLAADLTLNFQLNRLKYNLRAGILDIDDSLDLATLRLSQAELKVIRVGPIEPIPEGWPPRPPKTGEAVFFSGFPAQSRVGFNGRSYGFGVFSACLACESVTPQTVTLHLALQESIDFLGTGLPPAGFDIGGLSGAPLFAVSAPNGVAYWRPIAVISEAQPSLELVFASRMDAVSASGSIGSLA